MDFESLKQLWMTFYTPLVDFINNLIVIFREFGPLGAILSAFLESIFPFLPLVGIITFNIATFGWLLGFILSYVGTFTGSILVFLFFRKVLSKPFYNHTNEIKFKRTYKALHWVEEKGFTSIMMISIFPFTPSSLINITCGLSKIKTADFIVAVGVGKFVSVLLMSYFGDAVLSIFTKPINAVFAILLLVGLYFVSKKLEKSIYNHSIKKEGVKNEKTEH